MLTELFRHINTVCWTCREKQSQCQVNRVINVDTQCFSLCYKTNAVIHGLKINRKIFNSYLKKFLEAPLPALLIYFFWRKCETVLITIGGVCTDKGTVSVNRLILDSDDTQSKILLHLLIRKFSTFICTDSRRGEHFLPDVVHAKSSHLPMLFSVVKSAKPAKIILALWCMCL